MAGEPLISFVAAHATPYEVAANAATFDQSADNVLVVDFDDTTDEYCYFMGVMSGAYDGTSAIEVKVGWACGTASATMEWEGAFCRVDDDGQSIETLTFAAAQAVSATGAGTAGELDYANIDFTNAQADGVQANEFFVLRIMRDASEGTLSGDAELAFVNIVLN